MSIINMHGQQNIHDAEINWLSREMGKLIQELFSIRFELAHLKEDVKTLLHDREELQAGLIATCGEAGKKIRQHGKEN